MQKSQIRIFITTFAIAIFVMAISPSVANSTPTNQDIANIKGKNAENFNSKLEKIDSINPVVRDSIKLDADKDLKFEGKNKNIKLNLQNGRIKINKTTDFEIDLPKGISYEMRGDKVIGYNSSGEVVNSIENVEGGFRIVINVKESKAKTYTYDFPLIAKNGEKYEKDKDGNITLVDKNGKRLFSILPAWAKDSKNKDLKTWYTIENKGTVLRQNIDLSGASFPVLADPAWCGNTITDVYWVTGNSYTKYYPIYSASPSWCGRVLSNTSTLWSDMLEKKPINWDAWAIQLKRSVSEIQNSMYHQLECHNVFAFYQKSRYNLDIWRWDAPTYWTQYHAQCNVN